MKNSRTLKVIPNCQNLEYNFPLLFLKKKKKKIEKKKNGNCIIVRKRFETKHAKHKRKILWIRKRNQKKKTEKKK